MAMRSMERLRLSFSVTKTNLPSDERAKPLFVKDSPKVASSFTTRPVRAETTLTEVESPVLLPHDPTKTDGVI